MTIGKPLSVARKKQEIFLEELRNTGQVGKSAKAAGFTNSSNLRRLRKNNEQFAADWDEAIETAVCDVLEPEAWRRAAEGVNKGVYYQGDLVATEKVYSDPLLMFLLKANKPKKYRESNNYGSGIVGTFGVAILPMIVPEAQWEKEAHNLHIGLTGSSKQVIEHEDIEVDGDEVSLKRT